MARRISDRNFMIIFSLALAFGILLTINLMDRSACPEQKPCERSVCEEKECPVCECTQETQAGECGECICPACPTPKTITRYVCSDGLVVSKAADCNPVKNTDYKPITSNEEGTLIEKVTVSPACLYGTNGGSIRYEVGSIASKIEFQVKSSVEEEFSTIYTEENRFEGYTSFSLVYGNETFTYGDFDLDKDEVYLFRMKFYFPGHDQTAFSNEHIIDTRPAMEYRKMSCS